MRRILLVFSAMVGMSAAVAYGNYSATQGSGTTFGSIVLGGAHYIQTLLCDATTASQCAAVSSGGLVGVSANTLPLPTGAATQVSQATLNTYANGTLGAMANYGTSPGAVLVPGVNAFVTNANGNGQATMANSSPVVIASNQSTINTAPQLQTSSGWTGKLLNALSTTVVQVKASAGQVGEIYCMNPSTVSNAYIQVFNVVSASVSLGSTTPLLAYGIPASSASGKTLSLVGTQFGTAISVAATTTATGSSAPQTALDCNISFN